MRDAVRLLRAKSLARAATILLVLLVVVAAHHFELVQFLSDPEQARRTIQELGVWGLVAFVVAYAVVQPLGMSGMAFVLVAPLIWPWPIAFAVSMTGTLVASAVGFSLARFVARDWMTARIPARFRAYEATLERRGFATVLALRLPFQMQPMLHAFFGISRVKFWTHLAASALAYVGPLFLVSYFGSEVVERLRAVPSWGWVALVAGIVLLAGVRHLRRRRARRTRVGGSSGDAPPDVAVTSSEKARR